MDALRRSGAWGGVVEAFRERLALPAGAPTITLLEGNTPLIPAPTIGDRVGADVHLKFEGMNPTGSFKDRGMCVAVSGAVASGSKVIVCASTGNTSASAAAYAARAGLRCGVVIPEGQIALGKLAQALIHGASVIPVEGNFDDALGIVRELAETGEATLVNSVNPLRIEGQKTVAFEVVEQLGGVPPDIHCLPVGNAGNITAAWLGYTEALEVYGVDRRPAMWGAQAAGAAPIVRGERVERPQTIATAIRIGNPASWDGAVAARDSSGGTIEAVTDAEILDAYRLLASVEGVFCEPASAAGVALLLNKAAAGEVPPGATVVVTLTGHGLKDPDRVVQEIELPASVRAELDAVAPRLGL
ncbi:MAG: threonine synthase [Actinobacteria bacterium ATB1]|nr:threonine synthase [Actinobacteria bacterium ATB1]